MCAAAAGLVLAVAVAGNWAKHGRAEIGSFAGIALLGKTLVLLQRSDLEVMPPGTEATVPVAVEMQANEDVRFASLFPEAEARCRRGAARTGGIAAISASRSRCG